VKILNSIIFLGKASQYAKEYPANETTTEPNPTSSTDTSYENPGQSTQSSTQQDKKNTDKKPEKKTLAEIDRYTLCSKEIVLF
jgi:hypothetical protein